MNARLARRQAALAGVALVGALGAIALSRLGGDSEAAPPPTAVAGWETAEVAVFEPTAEPTACGVTVTAETLGIAHPVLPCGAKVVVEHQGRQSPADVVARGPVEAGETFELSPALARRLGVAGEATVRWRFAEGLSPESSPGAPSPADVARGQAQDVAPTALSLVVCRGFSARETRVGRQAAGPTGHVQGTGPGHGCGRQAWTPGEGGSRLR
jgi:hypothetical protein